MERCKEVTLLCSKNRWSDAIQQLKKSEYFSSYNIIYREKIFSEVIVLDWESRLSVRSEYKYIMENAHVYFMFANVTIDMNDEDYILQMEARALREKEWKLCKTINEAKIEISMIHKVCRMNCYPVELQLESTDICNGRCIMCSHFYRNGTHSLKQQFEIVDKIRHVLPYLRTIYLHGNGEPFILQNLSEYLSIFREYEINFATNTNLSYLDENIVSMINSSFSELNISCDGADKETYEYIRRGLYFDEFVHNSKYLRKKCPTLFMRMMCITMRQNIDKLPEIVYMAANLGFNEIVFTELGTDVKLENQMDNMTMYPQISSKYLQKAIDVGKIYNIPVRVPGNIVRYNEELYKQELEQFYKVPLFKSDSEMESLYNSLQQNNDARHKVFAEYDFNQLPQLIKCEFDGICDWCVQRPYIDLDGNISVCCINQFVKIGNLFDSSFEEVWNDDKIIKVRDMFYSGDLPHFCSGCEFLIQGMLSCIKLNSYDDNLYHKIHKEDFELKED